LGIENREHSSQQQVSNWVRKPFLFFK
jgi:hypothetical protein